MRNDPADRLALDPKPPERHHHDEAHIDLAPERLRSLARLIRAWLQRQDEKRQDAPPSACLRNRRRT
jgi:hypothetical protein